MVGLPYNCLANPLGAVRLTFEKAVASVSDLATFDNKDWGITDLFLDFLDKSGLSQVPILNTANVQRIQPNTLVQYWGMIQDMLGNEFYAGAYTVEYDFKYYKMEMAADVQLLILSEGKSNLLPADLVVPFRPSSEGSSEVVGEEALKAWRWYLSGLRSLPHSIEPGMQKMIEDDLVTSRQADRSLGSPDFSRWLTMGRLTSLSFGETCLSLEHWQMVKELGRLRRERVQ